jgi:anti-sigma regulatory factor (Ser/Thr protein kinase)
LLEISLAGEPGSERLATDMVAEAVAGIGLSPSGLERLRTAVGEAAMNAIEYGSHNDPTVHFGVVVHLAADDLTVRIIDRGEGGPPGDFEEPDIEKKLSGEQRPRGWGLFLIRQMVDAVEVQTSDAGRVVTLTVHVEGEGDARHPVQG